MSIGSFAGRSAPQSAADDRWDAERVGRSGEHSRLDAHFHRRLGSVEPHHVAMHRIRVAASYRFIPLSTAHARSVERQQSAMIARVAIKPLNLHMPWICVVMPGPEIESATGSGRHARSPQLVRAETGTQIGRGGRGIGDLGTTLAHRSWSGRRLAPDRKDRRRDSGGRGAGEAGQRWQRGQKQVDLPPETMRTIVALPQVRQR